MECDDLILYLSDYIDNELTHDLSDEAQAHLATCHDCRVVLDTTNRTITLVQQQATRKIPAGRRKKLFAELQEAFLQREVGSSE